MSYAVGYGTESLNPSGFNLPLFKTTYMTEYVRTNRFNKYMGMDATMPIQIDVQLKKGGQNITFPIMGRLQKRGVAGNMPLAGREEDLARFSHNVTVEYFRNGVLLTERDEHMTFAKALPQVRPHLMTWSKEQLRDAIIDAMFSVSPGVTILPSLVNPDATQVLPGDPAPVIISSQASPAQLNTWTTNNADRIVFGGASTNLAAGNFATSIGNVNAATDMFGAHIVDRMKMAAELANPHMTPIEIGDDGEEYWVIFCDPFTFAQAQYDPDILAFNQNARAREGSGWNKNPMRTGGDLEWNGCIIRKIQEMTPIGAGTIPGVAGAYGRAILVGAQAIAVGLGMDADFRERKDDDYGHLKGIGITECRGCNKFQRNMQGGNYIDNSCVTAFVKLG